MFSIFNPPPFLSLDFQLSNFVSLAFCQLLLVLSDFGLEKEIAWLNYQCHFFFFAEKEIPVLALKVKLMK